MKKILCEEVGLHYLLFERLEALLFVLELLLHTGQVPLQLIYLKKQNFHVLSCDYRYAGMGIIYTKVYSVYMFASFFFSPEMHQMV